MPYEYYQELMRRVKALGENNPVNVKMHTAIRDALALLDNFYVDAGIKKALRQILEGALKND